MVPFLNAILGTMLPMLGMAKQDNMKWVFSSGRTRCTISNILQHYILLLLLLLLYMVKHALPDPVSRPSFHLPALSHFSESILEYLANLDKAPDPTVRKDTFSSDIYAAYDILYCSWLQSRESKVHYIKRSRKPISPNYISVSTVPLL